MRLNQSLGEQLWQNIVDILGVQTSYTKEQCVITKSDGLVLVSIPLEKDLSLLVKGFDLEIRVVRTRYNKINKLLIEGQWEMNYGRWNIPESERLVADVLDGVGPLLEQLAQDYPHLEPFVSRAFDWVDDLESRAEARQEHFRNIEKRKTRIINFWVYTLIIGVLLLFFYVVSEGDPNRCVYIPDPRGGYTDC